MSKKLALLVTLFALGAAFVFASCSDNAPRRLETGPVTSAGGAATTSTSTDGVPYECNIDTALASCEGPICHGQPGVAAAATLGAGLDLFAPDRVQKMLDMPASYVGVEDAANCANPPELLINTTSPAKSLMIQKLINGQSCGKTMPDGVMIVPQDKQCIIDWVVSVAKMGTATATTSTSTSTATTSMGGAGGSTATTGTESTSSVGGSAGTTSTGTTSTESTTSTTSAGGSTGSTGMATMGTSMGMGTTQGAGGTMMAAGGSSPL